MINKYNMLLREAEDLENEIIRKISALEAETGQTTIEYFSGGKLTVAGTYFSTTFSGGGKSSTSPLCKSNDTPDTVDAAVEKAKEMFKAKDEWERLLVKIDEVLADEVLADEVLADE